MIGLSPLSPGHRSAFQRTAVRPSTGSYPRFSLPRDSSPGFASAAGDSIRPVRTRFRYGSLSSLTSPPASDSLAHSTKGTPSRREGRSDCSGAHGFRYCFTPLPGCFSPFPHGTGTLSVTGECSGLDGGPPGFGPGSSCPALLRVRVRARGRGAPTGPSPCAAGRPRPFGSPSPRRAGGGSPRARGPTTPAASRSADRPLAGLAMAPFRSPLLGGSRVDFSSSGYLDVSVPPVPSPRPMCSAGGRRALARRVCPFGDPRVVGRVPLTADYRSLPRPSSASRAKASAVRPCHLAPPPRGGGRMPHMNASGISYRPRARARGDQMLRLPLMLRRNITAFDIYVPQWVARAARARAPSLVSDRESMRSRDSSLLPRYAALKVRGA